MYHSAVNCRVAIMFLGLERNTAKMYKATSLSLRCPTETNGASKPRPNLDSLLGVEWCCMHVCVCARMQAQRGG